MPKLDAPIKLTIPQRTPSLNDLIGMHRMKYATLKKRWAVAVSRSSSSPATANDCAIWITELEVAKQRLTDCVKRIGLTTTP